MTVLEAYRGKTALVTGAGDGIGAMLARGFAEAGMRVCVQDIRADAAQAICEEIGPPAFPLVFDASDREAALTAAGQLEAQGERLSVLWLNAGVGVGSGVISGKANAIDWAFGVNVLGIIWTAQAFRPLMEDGAPPRHVGITASSAALRAPSGPFPLYAATKHGTFAVAEALQAELSVDGIGVTILCPGLLNTNIWDGARARPDRFGGVRRMDPAISTPWREAKAPDLMWPHIARKIEDGGGYLVCATDDGDTKEAFEARARRISDSIVDI